MLCKSEHVTMNCCEHEGSFMRFEVFTPMLMKVEVLWDTTHCQQINGYQCFGGACCLYLHFNFELWRPEDRNSKLIQNVGDHLKINMASYPRRLVSSKVSLLKYKLLK